LRIAKADPDASEIAGADMRDAVRSATDGRFTVSGRGVSRRAEDGGGDEHGQQEARAAGSV
jgi:hypothetical protein